MEKKRFEKTCSSADQKRFAFTVFLKLCFKTPKYIEFISMHLKDGSYPRGGGGLMAGCLFITRRVAYKWQFTVHTMYRLFSYIENIRY